MNITVNQQEKVASLGRPAHLGMLYDINQNKLIYGPTLWFQQELKTNVNTVPNPSTKIEILSGEDISEKTHVMKVDGSLKLDVLCGNVNVEGAASYLKEEKMSQSETQVVLHYTATTEAQFLTMEHLKGSKISHPKVLQAVNATHFVDAIQYGGNVVMTFNQKVEKEESSIKVKGKMKSNVEKLKNVISSSGQVDGNSDTDISKQTKKMKCRVYSDFKTKTYPSSYEEVEKFCQELPSLTCDGNIGVPLLLYLCPLDSLGDAVQQNRREERKEIKDTLIDEFCEKIEFLQSIIAKCNDLRKEDNLPSIQRQLVQFLNAVTKHRDSFKTKVAELSREIRSGSANNDNLESFLAEQESSIFSRCELHKWFEKKKEKMKPLQGIVKNLKGIPFVSSEDLETMLLNPNIIYVVCLVLKISSTQDVQLSSMETFFDKNSTKSEDTASPLNKCLVRATLKRFMSICHLNHNKKVVKFVAMEEGLGSENSSEESVAYLDYYCEGRKLSEGRDTETIPPADATDSWKSDVRWKLTQVYRDKPESLFEILFFLDKEGKAHKDNDFYALGWYFLKTTVNKDEAFQEVAKKLLDEIRNPGSNTELRSTAGLRTTVTTTVAHFLRGCLESISKYGKNALGTSLDDLVRLVDNPTGDIVMGGVAALHLSYTAINEIYRWRNDEISGKRCLKNLSDTTLTIGGGLIGGYAAGAFLSYLGMSFPGVFLGCVLGGWVASASMEYISDIFTRLVSGLPKEEALENAYRYLSLPLTATEAEVNTAFRKLCLQKHPDKGGKPDEFLALRKQMQIIRENIEKGNKDGKQCSNGNQIVKKELKW